MTERMGRWEGRTGGKGPTGREGRTVGEGPTGGDGIDGWMA